MIFGFETSHSMQWALWIALAALAAFLLSLLIYVSWRSRCLKDYEKAWWNHRICITAFLIWLFASFVLGFANTPISALFLNPVAFPTLTDRLLSWAFVNPVLYFFGRFLSAMLSSYMILMVYLSVATSPRRLWTARHFELTLFVLASLIVAIQTWGIYVTYLK